MGKGWTPERRARQAAQIHRWKPWEQSTGPRTKGGRLRASQNAYKGGWRLQLAKLRRLLRDQKWIMQSNLNKKL